MSIETNWCVITGAPSSGKTTTLEYLNTQGYKTLPETARVHIDEELAKGRRIEEVRADEQAFQRTVFQMKIDLEAGLKPKEVLFLDRGIPDSIAFYELHDMDAQEVLDEAAKLRYKHVFLLAGLAFDRDYARTETPEEAERLEQLLEKAYLEAGYSVQHVPVATIDKRAEFIIQHATQ